jgi:Lon protease-like protein
MDGFFSIPMFPLSIFPLPGEMVPLHIFEPRYRQLLEDAETKDISFGIYYNHTTNTEKLGSLVKLESVIKRYKTGESDIIVKCIDLFTMNKLYRTHKDKLYPGGDVQFWKVECLKPMGDSLKDYFQQYHKWLKITHSEKIVSLFDVANELSLGFDDRLKFVNLPTDKQESFLINQIKYQIHLMRQAEKAKDTFHLN